MKQIITFPEQFFISVINEAKKSTCHRSKCGSIVVSKSGLIIGRGYNSPPCDIKIGDCIKDSLPSGFRSDRTCCIHAEQRSIMDALRHFPDSIEASTLIFIRLDPEGNPLAAGEPYCTICSKFSYDAGVNLFCLYNGKDWDAYPTDVYNKLSFNSSLHKS